MENLEKIGLGGGCHWCTEGVFQSLLGIEHVEQGWISSTEKTTMSEAVIVHFHSELITLRELIEVHLYTHSSTSNHSFREKYRSAVYVFNEDQRVEATLIINDLQPDFHHDVVTEVLSFKEFKVNREDQLNYLYTRKNNAFCEAYIHPKLTLLLSKFSKNVNQKKLKDLGGFNQFPADIQ